MNNTLRTILGIIAYLLVTVATLLCTGIGVLLGSLFQELWEVKSATYWWGLVALALLIASLIGGLLYYLYHRQADKAPKRTAKDWRFLLLSFISLRLVVMIYSTLLTFFTQKEETANDLAIIDSLKTIREGPSAFFVLFVITICMMAPILEEIVHRGLFTQWIFKGQRNSFALLLSSASFATLHAWGFWDEWGLYFLMGIALYLVYQKRGSLGDAIILHSLNNGFALIIMLLTY